jgi:hypothetical protein
MLLGMFPRMHATEQTDEAAEDHLAFRLHLDLVSFRFIVRSKLFNLFVIIAHDSMARNSKAKDSKGHRVDVFRGVLFEDWPRVFMQVETFFFTFCDRNLPLLNIVRLLLRNASDMTPQTRYFDISFCPMLTTSTPRYHTTCLDQQIIISRLKFAFTTLTYGSACAMATERH